MSDSEAFIVKTNTPIILIGGTGRSGTTIFRRLFETHPDVCSIQEWRLPVDPGGLVDFYCSVTESWTPLIFDSKYQELAYILSKLGRKKFPIRIYRRLLHKLMPRVFSRLNLDVAYGAIDVTEFSPSYELLAEKLLCDLKQFSYEATWTGTGWMSYRKLIYAAPPMRKELAVILGGFFRSLVSDALQIKNRKFFLDKNTWYPLVFDKFHELVPEAKLVVILRDPRDVICSLKEQRWAPKDLLKAAQYFRGVMDQWYLVKSRLPTDCYIEINYEELVFTPDKVLQAVCEFSGLPMPIQPYGLKSDAVGRWRNRLNDYELEIIAPYIAKELGNPLKNLD